MDADRLTSKILELFRKNSGQIIIKDNENLKIENVNIYVGGSEAFETAVAERKCEILGGELKELMLPSRKITKDPFDTELRHVEKLENFYQIVNRKQIQPTVRIWGLFSAFGTMRQPSDTTDTACLELREKELLVKLAEAGCVFRIIINLNVAKALICGFSEEEIAVRTADLCATCSKFGNEGNVQIVIDNDLLLTEPLWIFGNALMCRQMNFKNRITYSASYWTSDIREITKAVEEFDRRFFDLKKKMEYVYDIVSDNFSNIVTMAMDKRIKDLF